MKTNNTIERINTRDSFINEFQAIINSMHVGVVFCDLKGKIVFVSPYTYNLHGYEESESLIGRDIYELVSSESKEIFEKYLQKVLKGTKMRNINLFLIKKDNSRFYGELSANLFKKNGQSIGFVIIVRNIDSKENIEKEFFYHCRNVAESFSRQTVNIFDKLRNKEYTEIKLLKTTWQLQQFHHELEKQKKTLETQVEIANNTINKLNREINIERKAKEKLKKDKTRLETLLEKQTIEFHRQIEENDRIKMAFLNNITHEIRTPLNGILGFAHLLVNTKCDIATKRMYAETINFSTRQLLDIMNDIIDLSKIETGDYNINEKEVCLYTELDDIYSLYEKIADEKPVKFIKKKDNIQVNLEIITDQYMLRGILFKLLDNAFKYTNEGYVETGYDILKTSKAIRFYVKDTGIGISNSRHDFIFEKFSKIDSSLTSRYGGCGIGLTIAKAFTEKLGGTIWLESVEDKGSTFYFTIPLKEYGHLDTSLCSDNDSTEIPHYDWKDKTILIVDNIKMNVLLIKEILADTGASCFTASNGKEAVEFIKNIYKADLILMDIRMPVMSGIEAVKEIKKINNDALLITQTAYINSKNKKEILSHGFDDYIEKPIKSNDLLSLIDKHFKKK